MGPWSGPSWPWPGGARSGAGNPDREVLGKSPRLPGRVPNRGCWLSVEGRRLGGMAKRAEDFENDPVLTPIGDVPAVDAFDTWLAGLERGVEPTVLSVPAAQLVAEGRAEAE